MTQNQNKKIAIFVRLRGFLPHAIIFVIATVIFLLAFQFMIGDATSSIAEIKRVNDSPTNEIVFAGTQNKGDTVYYLKNYSVTGSANKNAHCDVFMVMNDTEYNNNTVYFSGALKTGTCAVSANIASRYGLKTGERARIIGTDKYFTVERILPAQSGIDADYKHEGIIILAYDKTLLDKNYNFISFDTDGDGYRALISLVPTSDLAKGKDSALLLYGALILGVIILVIILCEWFLFKKRRGDYSTLVALGVKKHRLLLTITLESLAKYTLPALAVVLFYLPDYGCYRISYLLPSLFFILICTVICIAYSLLMTRRLYYVRAK